MSLEMLASDLVWLRTGRKLADNPRDSAAVAGDKVERRADAAKQLRERLAGRVR